MSDIINNEPQLGGWRYGVESQPEEEVKKGWLWQEKALRKLPPPSEDSFTELMTKLKQEEGVKV